MNLCNKSYQFDFLRLCFSYLQSAIHSDSSSIKRVDYALLVWRPATTVWLYEMDSFQTHLLHLKTRCLWNFRKYNFSFYLLEFLLNSLHRKLLQTLLLKNFGSLLEYSNLLLSPWAYQNCNLTYSYLNHSQRNKLSSNLASRIASKAPVVAGSLVW